MGFGRRSETCIKGHRSSACKHTDRPLFEIKKKGRPVTQCDHCRELRKTKQVHVKCLCGVQETPSNLVLESSHSKKGRHFSSSLACPFGSLFFLSFISLRGDFQGQPNCRLLLRFHTVSLKTWKRSLYCPQCLTDQLILTIAVGSTRLPLTAPIYSIDFSQGETSPSGCRCNKGEQCDCCTPRKPPGRRRSSVHHQEVLRAERHHLHHHHAESSHGSTEPPPPISTHVLARIAELRPVLPRPPRNDGPLHDPSSSMPHSHSNRHHTHENMYFSPYGRAYEHIHTPDHYETKPMPHSGDTRALPVRHQPPVRQNMLPGTQSGFDAWQGAPGVFPSACTCGDSCRCPGCSQHSSAPIAPGGAYAACTDPASCSFCLDCTILSLPPSSAPPSNDSTSDSQTREFEEWLRQISSASPTAANTVGMPSNFSPYDLSMNPVAAVLSPNPIRNHNANSNSNSSPNSHSNHTRSSQHPSSADGRCQGRCNCPSGTCSCQGGECDQRCNGRARSGSRTTYAVSGESTTCCDPLKSSDSSSASASVPRRTSSHRALPDYMTMTTVRDGLTASVANRLSPVGTGTGAGATSFYPDPPSYMPIGDAPSRSSSSSSLSSRMSGRSPINTVRGCFLLFYFWCVLEMTVLMCCCPFRMGLGSFIHMA